MGAFAFNVSKGKIARFCDLPEANDAIGYMILVLAGLESDSTLQDYASVAAILAASNDEATFTGYARIVHTASLVVAPNNTSNINTADDTVDPSWSPTTPQAIAKLISYYNPDTSGGGTADSGLIPMWADDFAMTTPTVGAITYQINAAGFYAAA